MNFDNDGINEDGIEYEIYERSYDLTEQMASNGLYTVIISTYKNFRVITKSIMSVLEQKYPRIELVIGDDGSDNFDLDAIVKCIVENKKENLERFVVRRFKSNHGIVANVRDSLTRVRGKYYSTVGGDDLLNDPWVINTFVTTMDENPELWWSIGIIAVVSSDYQKALMVYPSESERELLNSNDKWRLLGYLSYRGPPAPGMCYRTGVSELVGGIDQSYVMLEDWPLYVKLIKMGHYPKCINRYVLKQGSSGITKDDTEKTVKVRKQFVKDKLKMFRNEIMPFYKNLSKSDVKKSKEYVKTVILKQLYYTCDYVFAGKCRKVRLILTHPRIIPWILENATKKIDAVLNATKISYSSLLLSGLLSVLILFFINGTSLEQLEKILLSIPFILFGASSLLYYIVGTTLKLIAIFKKR